MPRRTCPAVVRVARLFALTALLLPAAALSDGRADLQGTGGGLTDELLRSVIEETDAPWWNREWKYRRRLSIEDPGLPSRGDGVVYVQDPDPLLLYNTGRCKDGAADLRVISPEGQELPCGVLGFGRDDGAAWIWCRPTAPAGSTAFIAYLYYGNPAAAPRNDAPPAGRRPDPGAVTVVDGAEETLEGAALPAQASPGSFFSNAVMLEAERFLPTAGAAASPQAVAGASGGAILRAAPGGAGPVEVSRTVRLPAAGRWRLHVGAATPGADGGGFTVSAAGASFAAGTNPPPPGAAFAWETFDLDAGAPEVEVRLALRPGAGPDCLLLSRDPRYRPDWRDANGPVWMRFRVPSAPPSAPFYLHLFGWHTTYSTEGAKGTSACWLFRDHAALTEGDRAIASAEARRLLKPAEWSAWGRALPTGQYTWYSEITALLPGSIQPAPVRRMEFECATRPDRSRIFAAGDEQADARGAVRVRMPVSSSLDAPDGLRLVQGFGQWARSRFETAQALGLQADRGPSTIVAGTMAHDIGTEEEMRYFLKTCQWLGFNLVDTYYPDEALYHALADEHRIRWAMNHHTAGGLSLGALAEPAAGETYASTIEARLASSADALYRQVCDQAYAGARGRGREPDRFPHIRYGIFMDEVEEVVNSIQINTDPFFHGLFVEYLRTNGLAPELFGATNWSTLRALDYAFVHPKSLEAMQKRLLAMEAAKGAGEEFGKMGADSLTLKAQEGGGALDDLLGDLKSGAAEGARRDELSEDDRRFLAWADEVKRNDAAKAARDAGLAGPADKRLYHWTQKFKNDYYCTFFRHVSRASAARMPPPFTGSVNLQPQPGWLGTMYDGQCNLFELGRQEAFRCLQWEDWNCGPLQVAFGSSLTRAAARRRGQELMALVVGHNPRERIMANLAQGCRTFVFYLYGPVHRIGPVWAEHAETLRDIGETLAQAGRCEADMLASSNRPADVAVLVANTSELNASFRAFPFGAERLALFKAALDAGLPVDLVGEEEVIHDGALDRVRLLLVGDPHVDARAQAKIRDWVNGGGTLFTTYAAAAYREYDEPSGLMDEVFGLADRGPVAPVPAGAWTSEVATVRLEGAGGAGGAFSSSCHRPAFRLSTGRAAAAFADGAPAIVSNAWGRGSATLCGFMFSRIGGTAQAQPDARESQANAGRVGQAGRDDAAASLRQGWLAAAASAADVHSHARSGQCGLWIWVHDGPGRAVAYLINATGASIDGEPVEIALPFAPAAALSGQHGDLAFEPVAGGARVKVSLPVRGCDILVFRDR